MTAPAVLTFARATPSRSAAVGTALRAFLDRPEAPTRHRRLALALRDRKAFGLSVCALHSVTPADDSGPASAAFERDYFMASVVGRTDRALLQWGSDALRLPRGLHLLCDADGHVLYAFGFLPKFENAQSDCPDIEAAARPCGAVRFTLKYSGSLAIFMFFRLEGRVCCAAGSKNSVDAEREPLEGQLNYARLNLRLLRRIVSSSSTSYGLPERLLARGISSVCGEAMYECDQVHGARVLRDAFVVTYLATASSDGAPTLLSAVPSWTTTALELALPVDGGYEVGVSDVARVTAALASRRDSMSLRALRALMDEHGATPLPGNVRHEDILGDTLEGLVIFDAAREAFTVKFKFPRYTMRTMVLRTYFQLPAGQRGDARLRRMAAAFCERWCSTPDGRKATFRALLALGRAWDAGELEPALRAWRANAANVVAPHILAAEWLEEVPQGDAQRAVLARVTDAEVDAIVGASCAASAACAATTATAPDDIAHHHPGDAGAGVARVVCVLGPVGSGKSEQAERLVGLLKANGTDAVHVDGDVLGLDAPGLLGDKAEARRVVAKLSRQRNPSTSWTILTALAAPGSPVVVVSCGGGVLFDDQGRCVLPRLATRLGLRLQLSLVLADACGDGGATVERVDATSPDAVRRLYALPRRPLIEARVRSGYWDVPDATFGKIEAASAGNVRFFLALLKQTDAVVSASQLERLLPHLRCGVDEANVPRVVGGAYTLRHLALLPDGGCGHVTLAYSSAADLEAALESPLTIFEVSAREVRAHVSLADDAMSNNKKKKNAPRPARLVVIDDEDVCGPGAHVTLDASVFQDRQMRDVALRVRELRGSAGLLELPLIGGGSDHGAASSATVNIPSRGDPVKLKLVQPAWALLR